MASHRSLLLFLLLSSVAASGKRHINPLAFLSKDIRFFLRGPFEKNIENFTRIQETIFTYSLSEEDYRSDLNPSDLFLVDEASETLSNLLLEMSEEALSYLGFLERKPVPYFNYTQLRRMFNEMAGFSIKESNWTLPAILKDRSADLRHNLKSSCGEKGVFREILKVHGFSDSAFSALFHVLRTNAIIHTFYATAHKLKSHPNALEDDEMMETHTAGLNEKYTNAIFCLKKTNEWRKLQSFQANVLFSAEERRLMLSEKLSLVPTRHNLFTFDENGHLNKTYHFLTIRTCGSTSRNVHFFSEERPALWFNDSSCNVFIQRYPLSQTVSIDSWDILTDNFISAARGLKTKKSSCIGKTVASCFAESIEDPEEMGLVAIVAVDSGAEVISSAAPMEKLTVEVEVRMKRRKKYDIYGFFMASIDKIPV